MGRRWVGVWAALASMLLVAFQSGSAHACSAGPDFNAVNEADIIVAGRITEWQPLGSGADDTFTPILLNMRVDQALKGSASGQLQFEDRASLQGNPATTFQWAGSSGACGAFDSDPAGAYVILGLTQNERGNYQSNRLMVFFIGADPSGAAYNAAVARLTGSSTPAASPATPATPQTLPDTGLDASAWMRESVVAGVLVLAAGALVAGTARRTTTRH